MRKREPLRAVLERPEQEHVHVHRAGTVTRPAGLASQLQLHLLAGAEQLLRAELGVDPDHGVQEVGLVEHLALGRGLVDRGGGRDLDAAGAQPLARGAQVADAVALVGAEAEVARQTCFQTSTETSSTGSGIGGSGLAALTRTDSAPKRSIRRSATAVHRRSRVR